MKYSQLMKEALLSSKAGSARLDDAVDATALIDEECIDAVSSGLHLGLKLAAARTRKQGRIRKPEVFHASLESTIYFVIAESEQEAVEAIPMEEDA